MADSGQVRAWLREQGHDVPVKGKIRGELMAEYDAAHPQDADTVAGSYDGGVTEADFPEPEEPGGQPEAAEQKPRRVRTTRAAQARTMRQRIWGGGGKKKKTAHPRISLKNFAEDMFLDLAWTFQGLPPIEKILYLQAPLAGQIVEDTCKGTVADAVLQPVARVDRQFKALEALTAPAWVAAIMVRGERETRVLDGQTVQGGYTPETKLLFGGLRHALLSMSRVTDLRFEEMKAKGEELRASSQEIDKMIAWLFEIPEPAPEPEPGLNGQQMAGAAA